MVGTVVTRHGEEWEEAKEKQSSGEKRSTLIHSWGIYISSPSSSTFSSSADPSPRSSNFMNPSASSPVIRCQMVLTLSSRLSSKARSNGTSGKHKIPEVSSVLGEDLDSCWYFSDQSTWMSALCDARRDVTAWSRVEKASSPVAAILAWRTAVASKSALAAPDRQWNSFAVSKKRGKVDHTSGCQSLLVNIVQTM